MSILGLIVLIIAIVIVLLILLSSSMRILREYEVGIIFRLGRYIGNRGPGFVLIIPGIALNSFEKYLAMIVILY